VTPIIHHQRLLQAGLPDQRPHSVLQAQASPFLTFISTSKDCLAFLRAVNLGQVAFLIKNTARSPSCQRQLKLCVPPPFSNPFLTPQLFPLPHGNVQWANGTSSSSLGWGWDNRRSKWSLRTLHGQQQQQQQQQRHVFQASRPVRDKGWRGARNGARASTNVRKRRVTTR